MLRFLSALLLPHTLHVTLAAPLCTYATRGAPLLALLLAGPARSLSQLNAYFLFGFGAMGDAFLSLTQPVGEGLVMPVVIGMQQQVSL